MTYPRPEGDVLVDGRWGPPSTAVVRLDEPWAQSAVGVFETLAVRSNAAVDVDAHVLRLIEGSRRLSMSLPEPEELRSWIREGAARVVSGFGWVKILAVRDGPVVVFGGRLDPSEEGRPVSAIVLPWRRTPAGMLSGLKTWNYAELTLGLEEARRRDADEGLWLDTRGFLLEGCASNLFVVRRERVFTPAVRSGILPGVTRSHAIGAIREIGLPLHEGKVRLPRLRYADEAFLTSSLRAVRPLVRFEGRPIGGGERGPVTQRIAELVERRRRMPAAVSE